MANSYDLYTYQQVMKALIERDLSQIGNRYEDSTSQHVSPYALAGFRSGTIKLSNLLEIQPYGFFDNQATKDLNWEDIQYIGSYAFSLNTGLPSLITLSSLTKVGRGMFNGNSEIVSLTLSEFEGGEDSTNWMDYSNGVFLSSPNVANATSETGALAGMSNLTTVSLPKLKYIYFNSNGSFKAGIGFFQNDISLRNINMPLFEDFIWNDAYSIMSSTCPSIFSGCNAIEQISLPNLKHLQGRMFKGNTVLTTVNFPEATGIICDYYSQNLITSNYNGECFSGCTALTSVTMPKWTGEIRVKSNNTFYQNDSYMFYGCTALTTISLPALVCVGSYYFGDCISLQTITAPLVQKIDSYAFNECSSLSSVSFPLCTYIGRYAFYKTSNLSTVNFPICTRINSWGFQYAGLTTVSFPEVTYVESYVFSNCSSLISASLPKLSEVGTGLFSDCTSITTVTVNSQSDFSNATNCFNNCPSLTTINNFTPSLMTLIPSKFFSGTSNLTNSYTFSNATDILGEAFTGCACTSLSFPSATQIYAKAFNGWTGTTLSLPEVTLVNGAETFVNVINLSQLSLPKCTRIFNVTNFGTGSNISSLSMPKLEYIDNYSRSNTTSESVDVKSNYSELLNNTSNRTFFYSSYITSFSFPELQGIYGSVYMTSHAQGFTGYNLPKLKVWDCPHEAIDMYYYSSLGADISNFENFFYAPLLERLGSNLTRTKDRSVAFFIRQQRSNNYKITSISFPALKDLAIPLVYTQSSINLDTSVTSFSAPNLEKISCMYGLFGLTALSNLSVPKLEEIGTYCFQNDTALPSGIVFPKLKKMGKWAFANTAFTSITIGGDCTEGMAYYIETGMVPTVEDFDRTFINNTALRNIYLPGVTRVPYVSNITYLTGSASGGAALTVHVPSALVSAFQAHDIWGQCSIISI